VGEEGLDLLFAHPTRASHAVEEEEPPDPGEVDPLGPGAVATFPQFDAGPGDRSETADGCDVKETDIAASPSGILNGAASGGVFSNRQAGAGQSGREMIPFRQGGRRGPPEGA